MPQRLDRCVKHVTAQGKSKGSAFAICNKSLGTSKTSFLKKESMSVQLLTRAMQEATKKRFIAGGKRAKAYIGGVSHSKKVAADNALGAAARRVGRIEKGIEKRKKWAKNIQDYGSRNPSVLDRVKKAIVGSPSKVGSL